MGKSPPSPRLQSDAFAARLRRMFTPKWKKEAKHLAKGARKFVHYKRDLLKPGQLEEIESRRTDLLDAIKSGDRAQVDEASKQLRAICENALPREKPVGWFEENVEVIFVAIVIALGLRAYYLQPFRIPTGSMQPTLNGIIGQPLAREDWPSFPQRIVEKILRGRTYVRVELDRDHRIVDSRGRRDDRRFAVPAFLQPFAGRVRGRRPPVQPPAWRRPAAAAAPDNPMLQTGLNDALGTARVNGGCCPRAPCSAKAPSIPATWCWWTRFPISSAGRNAARCSSSTPSASAASTSASSATRPPARTTSSASAACPATRLTIETPNLLIDGRIAQEPGIQRVIRAEGSYPDQSERLSTRRSARGHRHRSPSRYLVEPGQIP